jgi:hypothetical protein
VILVLQIAGGIIAAVLILAGAHAVHMDLITAADSRRLRQLQRER